MKVSTIQEELNSLAYHGRGIIIGKSADAKKAVTAYFIMGRSVNSRNRVFVAEGDAMRTKAFDDPPVGCLRFSGTSGGRPLRHTLITSCRRKPFRPTRAE